MADTHPYRLTCPSCGKQFKVSPKAAGRTLACPSCSADIKIAPPAPPTTEITDQPHVVQPSKAVKPSVKHQAPPSAPTEPQLGWLSRWARKNPREFRELALAHLIIKVTLPPVLVVVGCSYIFFDGWAAFKGILIGLICGVISLLVAPHLIKNILRSMPTVRCPGCGEEHSLVGKWSCGCGYNDHAERHVYDFTCPNCEGRIVRFNCPHCDATILL